MHQFMYSMVRKTRHIEYRQNKEGRFWPLVLDGGINYIYRKYKIHDREQLADDVVIVICTFCKMLFPEIIHLDTLRI